LGIQFAVTILVFVLLGQWVDRKAGTGGLFTILGTFVAFGGTLYSLLRTLNKDDRDRR
jgi:F0F1-type ATP synthase assembly protein I